MKSIEIIPFDYSLVLVIVVVVASIDIDSIKYTIVAIIVVVVKGLKSVITNTTDNEDLMIVGVVITIH